MYYTNIVFENFLNSVTIYDWDGYYGYCGSRDAEIATFHEKELFPEPIKINDPSICINVEDRSKSLYNKTHIHFRLEYSSGQFKISR